MTVGESRKHHEPEAENGTADPPLAVGESSVWIEAAVAECGIGLKTLLSWKEGRNLRASNGRIPHKAMLLRLTPHWAQKQQY